MPARLDLERSSDPADAWQGGINFIDCAEVYGGGGSSERVLGDAISIGLAKGTWDREDLVVSTKIHGGGRGDRDTINSIGLSRKHLFEGLQASLERLQLEYVDVSLRSEIASACSETQKLRLTRRLSVQSTH